MRVGFIGLGKLGMPCALAVSLKGHEVMGHDIDPSRMQKETINYREQGPNGEPTILPLLQGSALRFGSLAEVVRHSEILFVAVQTPHDKLYEGVTRIPDKREDFNYEHLVDALGKVSREVEKIGEKRVVIIISTVLPGTIRSRILPVTSALVELCYNPFFIAMGTTMKDFLNPEFVLFGVVSDHAAKKAQEFYSTLHQRPFYRTTLDNAEAIKVFYNTFIGMKIAFANTVMEICHRLGGEMNVDAVMGGLKLATSRLISDKYLTGGMGDGGGCHPRDNIALSWLSEKLGNSFNFFDFIMKAREEQTEWLVELMEEHGKGLPMVILGKAFKPETNITVGSPAILAEALLRERGHLVSMWDPHVDGPQPDFPASTFLIGTKHPEFSAFPFPEGSVVIDPHRYITPRSGVMVVPVGAPSKYQER